MKLRRISTASDRLRRKGDTTERMNGVLEVVEVSEGLDGVAPAAVAVGAANDGPALALEGVDVEVLDGVAVGVALILAAALEQG